jgi:hypothetical protein
MAKMKVDISVLDIDLVKDLIKLIEDNYLSLPIELKIQIKDLLEKGKK